MKIILNCSTNLLLLIAMASSSALEASSGPEQVATDLLRKMIAGNRTPGLQYILVDDSKTLFQFQSGMATLDPPEPVSPVTSFNGYSITKTFTAAAVVKLALENRIDLDKPVAQYLEHLRLDPRPTVRQTLRHTAGFANPNPMSWIHRADKHADFDEQAFTTRILRDHSKLISAPGEKFAYSNVGYLVLGELVRQVSGKPFDDYVQSELINPLSLRTDQSIAFTVNRPEQHARGHIRKWNWLNLVLGVFIDRNEYLGTAVDGWVPFNNILVDGKAYGGLVGNASGFARYLQAMLRREAPYTQDMLDTLWQIGATNSGKQTRTGLAWFHGALKGERYFMHSGGAGGYYCEIRIYPDANRASVIMTNNTGISAQQYLDTVDTVFLPNKGGEDS